MLLVKDLYPGHKASHMSLISKVAGPAWSADSLKEEVARQIERCIERGDSAVSGTLTAHGFVGDALLLQCAKRFDSSWRHRISFWDG